MIVQITLARNELPLIKELLPVWSKYSDGYVFMLDRCSDGTAEYLDSVKEKYNILEVIKHNPEEDELVIETEVRQNLFDAAYKHSNKIICLDADEYLDGQLSKTELEGLLDSHSDTLYHLQWIQYTGCNTIRVDGPWKNNFKDRIAVYSSHHQLNKKQNHSDHLPVPVNQRAISSDKLFIAHLSWLDKNYSAIKQYYWKAYDYCNKLKHGIEVINPADYDGSVNDFSWQEEYFDYELKINEDVFENVTNHQNYRVKWIRENTKKFNVPNLGDWGYNIHDSVPMYFCTVVDDKWYSSLLNMIGSIHKHNFYDVEKIFVYDMGLSNEHVEELRCIKKIELVQLDNAQLQRSQIIEDALKKCPHFIYVDPGTTILTPLNHAFQHLIENGNLMPCMDEGFEGFSKSIEDIKSYESTKHDILYDLKFEGRQEQFHLTHRKSCINSATNVYRSGQIIEYKSYKHNVSSIRRKYLLSVITGVGPLNRYESFIDRYFYNIQQQVNFNRLEFVIVYSEWSNLFDAYTNLENVRFIKEPESLGAYNAWNIGILNSTAEYVTYWNVDDLRYPINNKLKYDVLSRHIELDLVYNWYVAATDREIDEGIDLSDRSIQRYPDDYHLYTRTACMAGPDPMWRKSFHLFGGLFDYKNYSIVGDWEMWIRMSKAGLRFKLVPEVLCIYVDHQNNVSNSNTVELEDQKAKLIRQYYG